MPTSEDQYIEVTQDGIATITVDTIKKIPKVKGIYTEGLETCFALLICNDVFCTMIHASDMFPVSFFEDFFKSSDASANCPIKWWLVYNPKSYPKESDGSFSDALSEQFDPYVSDITEPLFQGSIEAKDGFISFNWVNSVTETGNKPENIISSPHRKLRIDINKVNNYYLLDKQESAVDKQYDGFEFSELPKLITKAEIDKFLQLEEFADSKDKETIMQLTNLINFRLSGLNPPLKDTQHPSKKPGL